MERSQYITVDELNEILGTSYDNDILITIYEASEFIKQHCFKWKFKSPDFDYSTVDAPNELKLATAYQVEFNLANVGLDLSYGGEAFSLGKYSESGGGEAVQEYKKVSPKAQRYLVDGDLISRGV